jgi:Leucine-rich repeat (LRR) protein
LTSIPGEIGRLTKLRRLQLSGNKLQDLPTEFEQLQSLEGLWLHGNMLKSLPSGIATLSSLLQLSLSGNLLDQFPSDLSSLSNLKELSVAGNQVTCLPSSVEYLKSLEKLELHGNFLKEIPETVGGLSSLKELALQGNPTLTALPLELAYLKSLRSLSVADCGLTSFPNSGWHAASDMKTLSLYGNGLKTLSVDVLAAPSLSSLWLEGNPLEHGTVEALLNGLMSTDTIKRITLGLDDTQVCGVSDGVLLSALNRGISISKIIGSGAGYFKLVRRNIKSLGKVLVVAFGSAPGVPNWGGLLHRAREAATDDAENDFDVLFVVDPARSWYGGGHDKEFDKYASRLSSITCQYNHVVMIGDSMGATAALMFADQATCVHAFCPQVDLSVSSIRPAKDAAWAKSLQCRVNAGVNACRGKVTVHVGDWKHDIDQVNMLPQNKLNVKVYGVTSHRLAISLDKSGKLLPMLRAAILHELGLSGKNVRISNLF